MKIKIGFIGGGNMGEALLRALLEKKIFSASHIGIFEPSAERRKKLKKYKIHFLKSNQALAQVSECLLLAVKPQEMGSVLEEIKAVIRPSQLVLSIAAGLDVAFFQKRLPPKARIIRIMPNLCALIGESASAYYAPPKTPKKDKDIVKTIFSAAGKVVAVPREDLLDVVTGLSGSGPAFVFLFMEALIQAGQKLGLSSDMARILALQTVAGSQRMAEGSAEPLAELISRVASKGGTTEAGLKLLHAMNFSDIIFKTIQTAAQRAKELRCIS